MLDFNCANLKVSPNFVALLVIIRMYTACIVNPIINCIYNLAVRKCVSVLSQQGPLYSNMSEQLGNEVERQGKQVNNDCVS